MTTQKGMSPFSDSFRIKESIWMQKGLDSSFQLSLISFDLIVLLNCPWKIVQFVPRKLPKESFHWTSTSSLLGVVHESESLVSVFKVQKGIERTFKPIEKWPSFLMHDSLGDRLSENILHASFFLLSTKVQRWLEWKREDVSSKGGDSEK